MDRMQPARILCSWDFPGKNMGVGCYFLLQGIFPIQGSNSYLLLGRWILYHWATSVQFSSVAQSCPTLCDPTNHSTPGLPVHHQLRSSLKLMSIEWVIPSSHLILCHPFLLLPSILPSIRVFSSESVLCIRWPKYWSFSFNISPSNEYSGLISFRMDWLDLPAVQGTLKSLSNTTVQKHQCFSTQPSLWSKSLIRTWLLENRSFDYVHLCQEIDVSAFQCTV